jgi:flagellar biosynthesis/type III secretory pathway protein FliH
MPDGFVSLAEFLRAPEVEQREPVPFAVEACSDPLPDSIESEEDPDVGEEALSAARRFRAALADALDARVERLLGEIAASVLARELRLAPADVRAIVIREIELAGEPPLKIRAHPTECAALHDFECLVVADAALRRGDVAIEVRSGTIAATLGWRLERALAHAAAP